MDVALCHDCNNCYMACTDEHADNDWSPYTKPMPIHGHRWMDILRRERGQNDRIDVAFLPKPCMQCENAPCAEAGDFVRRREDGIVMFGIQGGKDKDVTKSCPYGSVWWNVQEQVSQKCDFCAHLLDDGWDMPRCVHSCPTGALRFYTEEPAAFAGRVEAEGLSAYKAEYGTKPHVYYKNLYRFTKNFVSGSVLKDGDCAKGVTVTIAGAGITAEQVTDAFGEYKFDGLGDGEYAIFAEGREIARAQVAGASLDIGDCAL
jgi:Fe-S-cluster-containing dehydrogenase component